MKHILNRLSKQGYKKELILFTTFIVSSVIIWFAGPAIKLGEHIPLESGRVRVFMIVALYVVLLIKALRGRRKNSANAQYPLQINPLGKKIASVFNKALPASNAKIKLSKLPWFLVMGTAGSGKSSLLNNSQISFLPKERVDPESLTEIAANGACDWWLTPDAMLLDVPATYLTPAPETQWLNLFNKKWRGQNSVSGVIITMSLSELIDVNSRNFLIENLRERIIELKEKFGRAVPFYFTLTKCDLLPGFLDFFAHSGTDELGQAWGITLPTTTPLVETFTNRFNALIKRLNKQLIWRLHQERGAYERVFIKDFPLQIEHLKEVLIETLQHLTRMDNDFCLQGVYLTSAVQQSAPDLNASRTIDAVPTTSAALQIMRVPTMPSRSYFIRQFLLQGLSSHYGRPTKIWQKRPVIYGVCATAVTFTVAFLGYDIFYSQQKMMALASTTVDTFNIIVPQDKPQETQVGDSLTIVS
jgi:type VI secretion system protein ImpL